MLEFTCNSLHIRPRCGVIHNTFPAASVDMSHSSPNSHSQSQIKSPSAQAAEAAELLTLGQWEGFMKKLKQIAQARGLWMYMNGRQAEWIASLPDHQKPTFKDMQHIEKEKEQAMSLLRDVMPATAASILEDDAIKEDPMKALQVMKDHFKTQGKPRFNLLAEAFTILMDKEASHDENLIDKYWTDLSAIFTKIESAGILDQGKIDYEQFKLAVLNNGIPLEMERLRTSLYSKKIKSVTKAYQHLLSEKDRIREDNRKRGAHPEHAANLIESEQVPNLEPFTKREQVANVELFTRRHKKRKLETTPIVKIEKCSIDGCNSHKHDATNCWMNKDGAHYDPVFVRERMVEKLPFKRCLENKWKRDKEAQS